MIVILPILLPLACAATGLLRRDSPRWQRAAGMVGAFGLLLAAAGLLVAVARQGTLVHVVGGWAAPFGIVLVADRFAAWMLLLPAISGVIACTANRRSVSSQELSAGYYPLVNMLLAGAALAFLSGDIFTVYVAFEVMLMASFVLMGFGGGGRRMEGALKYVTLNLMASALLLAAIGILYGAVGTLNLADLAVRLRGGAAEGFRTTLAVLFLCAFAVKSAVFPFAFWLPASYHTVPGPLSALFAGILTKVGVYALIRVYTVVFTPLPAGIQPLLIVLAGTTMVVGVLGALAQPTFRRILAFHSVSQAGYMLMGLAVFSPRALAGSLLFLLHHALAKGNLFLVGGWVEQHGQRLLAGGGGFFRRQPAVAAVFLVSALSLAGIPPLSGFVAKLTLIQAAVEEERFLLVAVALAVSLLTLISMTKIWSEVFWKPAGEVAPAPARRWHVMAVPALLMLVIGCWPGPILAFVGQAAESLLAGDEYVTAVLGSRR